MCEELLLERVDNSSWGFRLTGGFDFGTPLTVIKVTGGSIAELSGVAVGDLIVEINGQPAKHLTHTDAQNCITKAGDRLTLAIMRGSELTPPPQTPLRGTTPMPDAQEIINDGLARHMNNLTEKLKDVCNEKFTGNMEAPSPFQTIERCVSLSSTENLEKDMYSLSVDFEIGKEVSDQELDELLTGNEEVLEEGVLGINFQKFHPQVDFIRKSEVFKALQTENTFKEIPEEIQLEKEPTKRFSTFLMKPKPPPSPKPTCPFWHYPKAPHYLPKQQDEDKEEPKRRIVKEKGHSVLWLFLGETGENVVDERWGTDEEEIINLSRNENREEDELPKEDDVLELSNNIEQRKNVDDGKQEEVIEIDCSLSTEKEVSKEITNLEKEKMNQPLTSEEEKEVSNFSVTSEVETKNVEQVEVSEKSIDDHSMNENGLLEKELAEIQAQITILEEKSSSNLYAQLLKIQQQLTRIVEIQTTSAESKKEAHVIEEVFVQKESVCDSFLNEEEYKDDLNSQKDSSTESQKGSLENEELEPVDDQNELIDVEYKEQNEYEVLEVYNAGEYELCEAPCNDSLKRRKKPLTPQARPIVLPGGRMWRKPKDAAVEEFYQGLFIEQTDVLVGTNVGVNFRKYVPPKFDVDSSAVCKLIREIEEKTNKGRLSPELEFFQMPIDKRHFYAATLPQPEPIGSIELNELNSN